MSTRSFLSTVHGFARRTGAAVGAGVLAVLLAGSAAWAQTTSESLDLVGPVAAVAEYREFPGSSDRALFQTWAFDEAGVVTERVAYQYDFRDGSLRVRQVTRYAAGQPLDSVAYDGDDQPIGQTVFRYDGDGRMVEEVTTDAAGVETRRTVYENDAAGNVVRAMQYRGGAVDRTVERDYDADGGLLEERRFDAEGRLTEVGRYVVPGLERDFVQYDEEGEVAATGRVIEGEHGNVLIELRGPDGSLGESYAWTYDARGRVVERRSVYDDGQLEESLTYAYDDDDRGNWVRQTTFEDDGAGSEASEIHEREIAYR